MKNFYKSIHALFVLGAILFLGQSTIFAQGATCGAAEQLCGGVTQPANTTGADGGQYGCLYTTPKQSWYFIRVGTSGSLSFPVSHSVGGTDIDFAAWGPFTGLAAACNSIAPATSYTNQVACNYTSANGGTISIPSATAGEFYAILVTNFSGTAGNITIGANTGTGTVTCTPPAQTCADAQQVCGSVSFNANTTGPGSGAYGCLLTTPNQTWLYVVVGTGGSLSIPVSISPSADVDFAAYGPYASVASACATINGTTPQEDCNYSTANGGTLSVASAVAGQVYMLLITNFSGANGLITLGTNSGTGTISCLPPPCSMSAVAVSNVGACNNNGTPAVLTDDYYTADITVTFANKPATGTLNLSGTGLHSTNTVSSVAVTSTTTTTTHVFSGVRLKADGAVTSVTAAFSVGTCTFTNAAIPAVASCSCAASSTMIWN